MQYIIGIDQSTQGTKAMLFDGQGDMLLRLDKPHAQLIDQRMCSATPFSRDASGVNQYVPPSWE